MASNGPHGYEISGVRVGQRPVGFASPANEIKVDIAADRRKIPCVARNEVSPDAPRGESNENIKMNFPGFVNVVASSGHEPIDDPSRFDPLPLVGSDDPEVSCQVVDESLHWP